MDYEGSKKFLCVRCGLVGKRHDQLETGRAICRKCEDYIGIEAGEARRLQDIGATIPDRLMYLYTSKQLSLDS